MKSTNHSLMISFVLAVGFILIVNSSTLGGNPLRIKSPGQPYVWPNGGRNIIFRSDPGKMGPISHADAFAQTVAAFRMWENLPTATINYIDGGPLPVDVDGSNFFPFIFEPPRGTISVIYDDDGSILQAFGGDSYGLAFVNFDDESGEIASAAVILSGLSFAGPGSLTFEQFFEVQVHEIGHDNGLDHGVVNRDVLVWGDFTGPAPYDTFPRPENADSLETMGGDFGLYTIRPLLHQDDRAIISTLYPEPDFLAHSGTITGRVLWLDGRTPVTGVNVVARNIANPFHDAVSVISGNFSKTSSPDDPLAGVYTLNGLTPGATYAVYVQRIELVRFDRRTLIRSVLPGAEEFYNGPNESTNPDTDDPAVFTPLTAVAGSPLTGKDIAFNRWRPGPLPLEFPYSVELLLPFPFEIGGQRFESVFVNTTVGDLTFGDPWWGPANGPVGDGYRSPPRHDPEPPSVAGLLAHLLPSFGGLVSLDQTDSTFTITFDDVPALQPDFSLAPHNTFAITLHAKRGHHPNRVTLSYGTIDLTDGLAGYSCGSRITSRLEEETDLSALDRRLIRGQGKAAIFEDFLHLENDLDNVTLTFEMPSAFTDKFEPNNSRSRAKRVNLPFNTVSDFADITPGDVDFYRFRARAGEIVLAETAPGGTLDTLLGLFGPGGTLLASNDDLVPFASSSARVIYTVPTDGEYTLAVTTSSDLNFTGAGGESGRYALTLKTYQGTILPLNGDDLSVEVPLRFSFPFQGAQWRSVWVSSNGNLTFGAPEPVSQPSDLQLPGFLSGPPRVAPFFTDLDPSGTYNGGLTGFVIAESSALSSTFHWVSVPKLFDPETNSFSVTLNSDGKIEMDWGAMMGTEVVLRGSIVGLTQGNGTPDPGSRDLSRQRRLPLRGTIYESFIEPFSFYSRRPFNVPSFDLSFDQLRFARDNDHNDSRNAVFETFRPTPALLGRHGPQQE